MSNTTLVAISQRESKKTSKYKTTKKHSKCVYANIIYTSKKRSIIIMYCVSILLYSDLHYSTQTERRLYMNSIYIYIYTIKTIYIYRGIHIHTMYLGAFYSYLIPLFYCCSCYCSNESNLLFYIFRNSIFDYIFSQRK